ncbi:MAG: Cell division protein ftsA [Candidatus Woesebacteria bacterium GW2011_GWB1_38_5b]|uniref:Cell division protein FtsA n=1 Tax=Candidatus Woesebacteria bacterium GW2011_GWB1_38_5b TaxID=1618569 RepID=A0A0G0K974_9BACT|nr:MAG: Cell division protein ftsA [Candidatus Woesebacteria bacterium GW2011_GWB1_38_5b]OGH47335.1 MAG: cell division protein FtsA [Candidatus Levybacteria bacterium RIFCSPLOWO2_01_FULL_39_10]
MTEGKIITGTDIGTSKIITVITKIDEVVNVLGVSEVPSVGIKKGQIVNIEEAVLAINSSIEAAERMAGVSISKVIASIGGASIESQNSRGVVAVSQPEGDITGSDVERVIDAAKAVSLPSTREIIHVLPRSFTVDGQEGIKDPVGMTGTRLEVETHIISAGTPTVRNLEKAFSQVGVDVEALVFSGYSSSLSALSDTEKELGVVLVDIGAGTIDISIYIDGSVAFSSVLPIGARHITNDLAIGLRISLESAEKVKLFLSRPKKIILKPVEEDEEKPKERRPSDEINLATLGLPEQLSKVSQKTLVDGIIRPRLNEIFTMVGLEIKKSGFGGQTPSGLVITGGGAATIGAVDAAKRMLAMPVRIGEPQNMKGIIDEIQGSSYSTVIGLAIYGALTGEGSSRSFKMNIPALSGIKISTKLPKKIIEFIKSFIP